MTSWKLPIENQYLETDPDNYRKMGAEALEDLLKTINLDELSYELRHKAHNETSNKEELKL